MAMTRADYLAQLQALLPPGLAWARDAAARLTQLLDALAAEFARCDGRADNLLDEADPRTTYELLSDWERVAGLPADCSPVAQTLAERRDALLTRLTERGGQSIAYFIAVAAKLGYAITIDEFRPTTVGNAVNAPIYGTDWAHAWRVNAPAVTVRQATVTSGVDESLQSWGNALLECAINADKPAHSIVLFAYQ